MSRDFHLPGRSPVIACDGMAATSHPLATLTAVETLRAGGNAVDAAVAAVAVLCVVEPHMTGIGGDCFCMIAEPGKPVWGYNGSGRAGGSASTEALIAQGMHAIGNSIHAVTVPGVIDAWEAILAAHGRFGLDRALAPAIRFAEGGFPVAARIASDWAQTVGKLRGDPGATRHYLFGGAAPAEGDVIRLPALAQTLKTIAAKGPRAFYEGPIADEMVATVAARGSVLTAEDFAGHRGDVVEPITTNYRGLDLYELPPNGQGLTALVLLNILERFDLAALDPLGPDRFHIALEAARLAYAVRDTHSPIRRTCAPRCRRSSTRRFAAALAATHRPRPPRRAAARAGARQRHGLSHGGRPRPHGGVVDQYAVLEFRRRHLHRADRHHAAPTAAPASWSIPSIPTRSGPASGRCTPSSRRSPSATAAATCRSASWARTTSRWDTCRSSPTWSTTAWTCRRRSTGRAPSSTASRPWSSAAFRARRVAALAARGHEVAVRPLAARRRAGDPHRLAARRADRRLRSAQGRLRARLLTLGRSADPGADGAAGRSRARRPRWRGRAPPAGAPGSAAPAGRSRSGGPESPRMAFGLRCGRHRAQQERSEPAPGWAPLGLAVPSPAPGGCVATGCPAPLDGKMMPASFPNVASCPGFGRVRVFTETTSQVACRQPDPPTARPIGSKLRWQFPNSLSFSRSLVIDCRRPAQARRGVACPVGRLWPVRIRPALRRTATVDADAIFRSIGEVPYDWRLDSDELALGSPMSATCWGLPISPRSAADAASPSWSTRRADRRASTR